MWTRKVQWAGCTIITVSHWNFSLLTNVFLFSFAYAESYCCRTSSFGTSTRPRTRINPAGPFVLLFSTVTRVRFSDWTPCSGVKLSADHFQSGRQLVFYACHALCQRILRETCLNYYKRTRVCIFDGVKKKAALFELAEVLIYSIKQLFFLRGPS